MFLLPWARMTMNVKILSRSRLEGYRRIRGSKRARLDMGRIIARRSPVTARQQQPVERLATPAGQISATFDAADGLG